MENENIEKIMDNFLKAIEENERKARTLKKIIKLDFKEYRQSIAVLLIKNGFGTRETQRLLEYKSPRSIDRFNDKP